MANETSLRTHPFLHSRQHLQAASLSQPERSASPCPPRAPNDTDHDHGLVNRAIGGPRGHPSHSPSRVASSRRNASQDPYRLAGRTGRVEVYHADAIGLRAGDRIRWIRNDTRHELINSATAEVTVEKDRTVMLRLENGRVLDMRKDDSQLCHVARA